MDNGKIKIMISSSIWGFDDNIRQVAAYLEKLGYEVISSLLGTVKVHPDKSNLENSVLAVEECDVFLGFIRTFCGTGKVGDKNITFEEFKRAIELDKPYWFMAEHDVEFSRKLFSNGISAMERGKGVWEEMYDFVTKSDVKDISSRTGNWVQPFYQIGDIIKFVQRQFEDVAYIREIIASKTC